MNCLNLRISLAAAALGLAAVSPVSLAATPCEFHADAAHITQPAVSAPTLNLSATAARQVVEDEMVVRLAVEREGPAIGALNTQVLAEAGYLVAEARKADGISVESGPVSTQQVWNPTGKPVAWRVRAEVVLKSRDFVALGKQVGALASRAQIASSEFRLSAQAREAVEAELQSQAAALFRSKAQASATSLGYAGFEIKDVSLSQSRAPSAGPVMGMVTMKAMAAEAAPLPAEPGKSEVSVSYSGAVVLKR